MVIEGSSALGIPWRTTAGGDGIAIDILRGFCFFLIA